MDNSSNSDFRPPNPYRWSKPRFFVEKVLREATPLQIKQHTHIEYMPVEDLDHARAVMMMLGMQDARGTVEVSQNRLSPSVYSYRRVLRWSEGRLVGWAGLWAAMPPQVRTMMGGGR